MANIRKVEGKNGVSYKITVTHGRDVNYKQIRHYLTWTPSPKMTEKQVEKELNRVAVEFEKQIEQGFAADDRQTLAQYAEYVIDLKERSGTKHRTIVRYRELMQRINEYLGHLKLNEIRPKHLNDFYTTLSKPGIRDNGAKARTKIDLYALLKQKKIPRVRLAQLAGVSATTITTAAQGNTISLKCAQAIARALELPTEDMFIIEENTEPLSTKTIIEYHRLISTILHQAEREMIVLYNAASKATPPKLERHEAETFQPEEIEQIRDCLEQEPIKWRTATHLLLISGARRGEVLGLKWHVIDWENNQIKIERTLLYSTDRGIYEDTPKTKQSARYIKLPTETMALLKQYRQWYLELQLANGDQWQNSGYLFVQDNGSPMNPDSLTDWLGKFSVKYNLPHVNPHKFRHSMASLLYFNGMDSVTISKRLGHAKVSTTTDIYSHVIKQADAKAAECIADVILRPNKKDIG